MLELLPGLFNGPIVLVDHGRGDSFPGFTEFGGGSVTGEFPDAMDVRFQNSRAGDVCR